VPSSLSSTLAQVPGWGARMAFTGLLGTNPPYATAQKTRGTPMGDADYAKVKALQDQHKKQQTTLDAELTSGQMSPYKWRQAYLDENRTYQSQMQGLFHNAPEYVNGADGLVAAYQAIYDDPRVTLPDGRIDQSQLAALQAQFRSEHTPDQMKLMETALRKNDAKYPGVALYHKVLDKYDKWQENYAAQHGVDVTTLRQEIGEYNALYGDSAAQSKYLQHHRDLRAYDGAVKAQWDRSMDGMLYQLFHGEHVALQRTLKSRHTTVPQLESEVQQEA